ncbi:MAG: hypothetical protein ACT4QA_13665 [Panacagrimonas sp.]
MRTTDIKAAGATQTRGRSPGLVTILVAGVFGVSGWIKALSDAAPEAVPTPVSVSATAAPSPGLNTSILPQPRDTFAAAGQPKETPDRKIKKRPPVEKIVTADTAPCERAGPGSDEALAGMDPEQLRADDAARQFAMLGELASLVASEPVDRAFRDRAQVSIDRAVEQLAETGVQLVSSDCRSTLCKVDFWTADADSMARFLDAFPNALGWTSSMSTETPQQAGGGVQTAVFLTRDATPIPSLASARR